MDVKEVFLNWTKRTVPNGKEYEYLKDLIPPYFKKDVAGNFYHVVGDNPDTMFNCHFDTVGGDKRIVAVEEDNGLIKSDGTSILGADDKAGVVVLLYMIEAGVPGLYYFFLGEEVGCIGSGKLSKYLTEKSEKQNIKINKKNLLLDFPSDNIYKNIRKVVSFDRMGYTSVITHQMNQRCCSDEFANSLAKELNKYGLNFEIDDSGVYSDSAEFADIYPECTNLSVGYFSQHTNKETQDIDFLESLCKACVKVKWNKLPIFRNPKDIEYIDTYYNYTGFKGSGKGSHEYERRHRYIYDELDNDPLDIMEDKEKDVKIKYFIDIDYDDYISDVSFIGDKMVDINLSGDRLSYEIEIIEKLLKDFDIEYDDIYWDGLVLVIENEKNETKLTRNELIEHLPELSLEEINGYSESETDI